jgi:hypothetical protein
MISKIIFLNFFLMIMVSNAFADSGENFNYNGKHIHPGCIRGLQIELNGDGLVNSVNLNGMPRGCMDSNKYYRDPEIIIDKIFGDSVRYKCDKNENCNEFSYTHLKDLGQGYHILEFGERYEDGHGFSDIMIVKLHNTKMVKIKSDSELLSIANLNVITRVGSIYLYTGDRAPITWEEKQEALKKVLSTTDFQKMIKNIENK